MYHIIKTDSSFCPTCGNNVHLLSAGIALQLPSFYICFGCHRVSQVAVGLVKELTEEDAK